MLKAGLTKRADWRIATLFEPWHLHPWPFALARHQRKEVAEAKKRICVYLLSLFTGLQMEESDLTRNKRRRVFFVKDSTKYFASGARKTKL